MMTRKTILWRDKETGKTVRGFDGKTMTQPKWDAPHIAKDLKGCREHLKDIRKWPEFGGCSWRRQKDNWLGGWYKTELPSGEEVMLLPNGSLRVGGVWTDEGADTFNCHIQGDVGGSFGFNTHNNHPNREPACVEDLADDAGKNNWPDYVHYTDAAGVHHEGPSPRSVANKEDFQSYLKLTGQRVRDRGEHVETPLEKLRKRVRKRQQEH